MMNFLAKKTGVVPSSEAQSLARLEFEMALEIGDSGAQQPVETVRNAARSVGGDLVFALPARSGQGVTAMVRLIEDGHSHFLQVRSAERGFSIAEEGEIDADFLGFARTSIDLLERLRADGSVLAPLASPAH